MTPALPPDPTAWLALIDLNVVLNTLALPATDDGESPKKIELLEGGSESLVDTRLQWHGLDLRVPQIDRLGRLAQSRRYRAQHAGPSDAVFDVGDLDLSSAQLGKDLPASVVEAARQFLDTMLATVQVTLVGEADLLDEYAEPEVDGAALWAGLAPVLGQLVHHAACQLAPSVLVFEGRSPRYHEPALAASRVCRVELITPRVCFCGARYHPRR